MYKESDHLADFIRINTSIKQQIDNYKPSWGIPTLEQLKNRLSWVSDERIKRLQNERK